MRSRAARAACEAVEGARRREEPHAAALRHGDARGDLPDLDDPGRLAGVAAFVRYGLCVEAVHGSELPRQA
jgi:hypothetical protein